MLLMLGETSDKTNQTIIEIPKDVTLELMSEDHSLHEVIDMTHPTKLIRVFFDIDSKHYDPISEITNYLCSKFNCVLEDWAISSGNRKHKFSYHIMSRKFCMSIENLRKILGRLHRIYPYIDESILYFSFESKYDYSYCRLPNQSKDSIHKPAPPMKIKQGELSDFLITEVDSLIPIDETHLVIP